MKESNPNRQNKKCSNCLVKENLFKRNTQFQGTFEEFLPFFEKGLMIYGSYWHHVKSAWSCRDHPNFSFLWFEEMKDNQRLVVDNLCKFLHCSLSEEKLDQLVEHLKFDNMKENRAVDVTKGGWFMRKGKVGDFRNYFNEEVTKRFDKWINSNLSGTNIPAEKYFVG